MRTLQEKGNLVAILYFHISQNYYKKSVMTNYFHTVPFFIISSLDLVAYLSSRKFYNQLPNVLDKSIIK